jgi:predicted DCC family thiol-disulfide oxidoreductase YuxK
MMTNLPKAAPAEGLPHTAQATEAKPQWIENLLKSWNSFWFEPTTPVAMAIFRIFFGIILLENMLVHLLPDFDLYYGKNSLVPINDMMSLYWHSSYYFDLMAALPADDKYIYGAFWVMVAATVMMTLGLCTRVSSWVTFLLLMSFGAHFQLNQNAGDNYLRLATMCLALSNAGDAFSLDNLIRATRQDWRKTGFGARLSAPWAQRLLQIQICIAYGHTWYSKMEGKMWNDGTAVYYAVRYDDLMRFPIPHIFDQLPIYMILTWGTLAIEFALFTFIWWRPTRYWVMAAGLSLHLGIEYCMNLPMFEWSFMLTYLLFIYPEDLTKSWNWLKAKIKDRFGEPYRLAFDGSCILCVRTIGLIHRLDIFGRIKPLDFTDKDNDAELDEVKLDRARAQSEILLQKRDGNWLGGFKAFRFISLRTPLLWPLTPVLFVPIVSFFAELMYKAIAANRKLILGSPSEVRQ